MTHGRAAMAIKTPPASAKSVATCEDKLDVVLEGSEVGWARPFAPKLTGATQDSDLFGRGGGVFIAGAGSRNVANSRQRPADDARGEVAIDVPRAAGANSLKGKD